MKRDFKKTDEKIELYLDSKIISWVDRWEEYSDRKGIWESKKQVECHLYRLGSKWQPLNLGGCNDGGKFTAVNQAINQAKDFVNCCNKYGG